MSGPGLATVGHIDWDSQVKVAGRESLVELGSGQLREREREKASPVSEYQLEISPKNDHKVTKGDVCGNLRFCIINWPSFYSVRKTFGAQDCF